ncbi:hypothetical protein FIBSPDRAFT_953453 [Athelia psychrophila]|uniref:Uncharacterized protein n=1 Tax=Athelia psychrophila TaxID=1759441 RepID=A0A166KA26_9AGAM|nr:hypothetical protein FIBSPDRAFT_953453 [Fibularhizoctonia sp. CBS 109695]
MKGKVQDCVDLSFPNLHFLSHLIAFDTETRHLAYIASVKARVALSGSVQFFFLDYVNLSGGASSINVMDADDKKPWFPFSDGDNLYQEWRQLLAAPNEQLPRLLVAIPRGAQMMTAAIVLTNGGASQNPTIGIRWLHCQ